MDYVSVSESMSMSTVTSPFVTAESWTVGSSIVRANSTLKDYNLEDLKMDSNFAWLLCSLISAISWIMYITFYNSRVTGYAVTKLINRFYVSDGAYFKLGSLTLNVLSGKIMFRDVSYITQDWSARVQDGYLIFRWWRSYVPKDATEDLSHSDTRLSVVLNGAELHVYNRSTLYAQLERIFGLEPCMRSGGGDDHPDGSEAAMNDENAAATANTTTDQRLDSTERAPSRSEAAMARTWRDLIPVIKMDVSSGRVVFGNRLVPTTLSVTVEESHWVYSTKPPASPMDRLMHFCKCWAENARVMLAPSPKYTGMLDDPPRYMGEGFVLASTNYLEMYAYMDEPGSVPERPVLARLANGDAVESSPPMWGVDVKCGKGTDFSYGPWADRQREHLFRFFFPQDYQPLKQTPPPCPGDKRVMHTFDIRLSMLNEATIDLLFSEKNKETNAVHVNVGAGSYMEVTLPWVTQTNGYTTRINGQLLHLEATTSLPYRHLVQSETLEFAVSCHYPLVWNHHQQWELSLTGCKATVHLAYAHKTFFQDLVNDWSSKQRPDVMHFVPYTWRLGLTLKHCELITPTNEYNWLDCSSGGRAHTLENAQLALCAHLFHLSFELPFDQFLPDTTTLNFVIQGESIDLSLYLPETHTSRMTALALEREARVLSKDSSSTGLRRRQENIPKWRNVCQRQDGWLDFWWVPIGAINIQWVYHPAPPLGPQPQADISTPVKEELLLSPMRFPHHKPPSHAPGRSHCRTGRSPASDPQRRFDPTTLASDRVTVELEIGPSVLLLYGSALRNFLHIKENVFGDDQTYTDMQSGQSHQQQHLIQQQQQAELNGVEPHAEEFDQRDYRPLEVDVSIIMHDIQAHLLKHCAPGEPPCPVLLLERFGFEMKKRYEQTELQLLLSPAVLLVQDTLPGRSPSDKQLGAGRLALSSLQLRGHAMFSDTERALDEETLEYAWLLELQLGRLSGRLTASQLHQLVTSLETLVLLATDPENELSSPHQTWQQQQQQPQPTEQQQQQHGGVVNAALHTLLQPRQQDRRSVSQGAGISAPTNTPNPSQQQSSSGPDQQSGGGDHPKQPPSRQTSRTEPQEKQPVVVEPTTEADAHQLKYKFVRVAVDVIDIWLVESGTALQLWLSPVRLATCNLHGRRVSSGLSCVLYNGQLRQLTCQTRTPAAQDLWLEVANVSLGNLLIESVMSVTGGPHDKELPNQQDAFLRLHDTRTKRLWFLWPDVARGGPGRCGCTGGTAFFGNNRNGPRFFRPSPQDLTDGINVACFRINEAGRDPGYGQSILHEGQLVFRTPPYVAAQDIRLQEPPPLPVSKPPPPTQHQQSSETQQRCASPEPRTARSSSRRFSYTLTRSGREREVPYARLVDMAGPATLPAKLDSDSKLHQERPDRGTGAGIPASHARSALDVPAGPDGEHGPKNSVSDSKLAVDYFSGGGETVNPSESQHSLEERLRREVQRTTSMSSENQSEAFFSADEELNPSRTSSLRHSIISTGGALASHVSPVGTAVSSVQQSAVTSPAVAVREHSRKKFASDLSIVMDRTGIAAADVGGGSGPNSLPEGVRSRLSSHRSDHEIHTPEHRGSIAFRRHHQQSKPAARVIRRDSDERSNCDSSDSRSLSSNSYVSAVCSQEDMTLVDLHMQLNRQILDSPMLMSSYVSHLTQSRCPNWNAAAGTTVSTAAAPPLFKQQEDGKLQYVGGAFVPHMDTVAEGVTLLRLVTRHDIPPANTPTPTTGIWDGRGLADMNDQQDASKTEEEDELLLGTATDRANEQSGVVCSRTALVVRLQGELHVTVTPLLLESLQRFVDALIPTLASKHPLTVINKLHASCIAQVAGANTLKREKGVALRMDAGTYEQCVRTQLQAAVVLPRVNVTLLQASIVEEIISFSALDNIRDLTCVSLFAVCLDRVTARFHSGRQARELVQIFQRPTVTTGSFSGKKRQGPMAFLAAAAAAHGPSDRRAHSGGAITGEPVFIETSEKQQEETVVSLCVGRVHAQLRRLTNDSSCLEDAVITAIPPHSSKVLFSMRAATRSGPVDHYYMKDNEQQNQPEEQTQTPTPPPQHEQDRLGFIMFECGLEGVSVKVVKRSQFEKADGGNEDKLTCKTDSDIYICAESVRSRDDVDSVDKSEASTQTTLTSQQQHMQQQQQHTEKPPPPPKEETPPKETGGTLVTVPPIIGGNVSSCVIDLKTVWFNFAAPPRAPITRKLDYTRLDWNLLSTASPAINAWMNPSNRLAIRCVAAARTMYRRETGAVACLMAEALDVQQIHVPVRGRFGRLTPLASTLQEDPSCQLCAVLERYVLQVSDAGQLEGALADGELPQLSTLRQGVIVLSRQWKNVLYTPLLLDHNYKSKYVRPLNVTFTLPDMDEVSKVIGYSRSQFGPEPRSVYDLSTCAWMPQVLRDVEAAEARSVNRGPMAPVNSPRVPTQTEQLQQQQPAQVAVIAEGIESVLTSPSPPAAPHRRHRRVHHQQIIANAGVNPQQPPSSRASVVFPILAGNNPWSRRIDESVGYGALRDAAGGAAHLGSEPSVCTHSSPELPSSPTHRDTTSGPGGSLPTNPLSVRCSSSAEDLYSWMAKQQEYVRSLSGTQQQQHAHKDLHDPSTAAKLDTLGTDSSGGGEHPAAGVSLYPMRDSLRLLDAHMIFQPLLSSLGVLPHQMVSSGSTATSGLDSLGSNFSLVGAMDQMRIDIVVSDSSSSDEQRRDGDRERSGSQRIGRLRVDCTDESPAFVCERVSVELELEKMADMTVDEMIRTRNVLYISRGQLKKHTSTALNFSIAVRHIAQQVNMPLLRLLHQISNMYQNVKDTQNELREQRPPPPRHDIDPEPSARRSPPARNNRSSSASDLAEHGTAPLQPPLTLKVSDPSSILSGQQQPLRPVVSPSASVRSRPQSFAQKLRSTGKSVKGYMNLSEGVGTPVLASSPSASAAASLNGNPVIHGRHCWKTVYHLLELYATMPDTKTITHRFSVGQDTPAAARYKYDLLPDTKSSEEFQQEAISSTPVPATQQQQPAGERTRLVVFGVARIHRTRLLATLSGLKLEAEITSAHSSLTCRKKSRPATLEFSLTGQVGRTMIVLLEGVAPSQQTVVRVTVGKSQALYSSVSKRGRDKNSGLLTVGAVIVDIPQHPVALHGMVTRGSKQLSSTLQELRVQRTASRISRQDTVIGGGLLLVEEPQSATNINIEHGSPSHQQQREQQQQQENEDTPRARPRHEHIAHTRTAEAGEERAPLLQGPLVMQFSVIVQSLGITAALLPSLQAQYKMDQVNSTGVTGSRAKFTVDLPQHSLSFTTKLHSQSSEANLPAEASIALPAVHVTAEYVPEAEGTSAGPEPPVGLQLRRGGYLAAHADIGVFEHSLTTDLLNHLVFVQKVFMREVNEVVQKVYGGERPVPLWLADQPPPQESSVKNRSVLFTLVIRLQRIQLTATTAGSSAVRLETGALHLELNNRVQAANPSAAPRLFGKAHVDVNLSLGQLTRNPMFEEAEPDFQQFAFFNTRIGLRNAFQDEPSSGIADSKHDNKEVVLITLKRPLVYVQPLAVDKAILVWLNYKNAYDYWNEKRANLNKEVLTATQQVLERVAPLGQLGAPLSQLFLQLTVDDMGICLPLNPPPQPAAPAAWLPETRGAVVVTLESTSIAACSSGSLVSKGRFANLCLRFADDFDPSLDDWKPDMADTTLVNLCVVSEGTYEVCSRTVAARQASHGDSNSTTSNAKWFLNVQWQMEGVDMNVDVSVGKQLSALGHTLTMLAGSEDGPARAASGSPPDTDSDEQDIFSLNARPLVTTSLAGRSGALDSGRASQDSVAIRAVGEALQDGGLLPAFVFDSSLDSRKRSRLIEKEMNEQAKIINDLRSLGASHHTIEQEMRRLHELEALVFKDFRRDMIQKLRRQSVKASSIKGKLGLGSGASAARHASAYRSRSFIVPSPTPERRPVTHQPQPDSPPEQRASYESSPRSGPSRSASLRVRGSNQQQQQQRVTFSHQDEESPSAYMDVDGQRVELRRSARARNNTDDSEQEQELATEVQQHTLQSSVTTPAGGSTSGTGSTTTKSHEPNIDFELDVKVLINSGKCVLHTKEPASTEDAANQSRLVAAPARPLRKDRSCSAGLLDFGQTGSSAGSPDTGRRNKGGFSGGRYVREGQRTAATHTPAPNQLIDLTIFRIPGMDVKVHYESKVLPAEENQRLGQQRPRTTEGVAGTPDGSDPSSERTVPCNRNTDSEEDTDGLELLDQEQDEYRLPPLSLPVTGFCNPNYAAGRDSRSTATSGRAHAPVSITPRSSNVKKASLFAWMTLQSIPEETIISPHILEFLEQTLEPIPQAAQNKQSSASTSGPPPFESEGAASVATYNYVYASSFPVDVIVYFHMQPSTFRFSCLPVSRVECMLQLPSLDIVFSSKRADEPMAEQDRELEGPPAAIGGLSVTGCLADFSVYIFHPYGGGKKSGGSSSSGGAAGLAKDSQVPQWSPLADTERKDSLSINVEFVKFHLSRSRKLNFQQDDTGSGGGRSPADQSRAVIRFSTIVDIGSASFKYDMRRLTEILAFPKAWYRHSIVRRLFLGDLSYEQQRASAGQPPRSTENERRPNEHPDLETQSSVSESPLSRSAPEERSAHGHAASRNRDRLRLSLETGLSGRSRTRHPRLSLGSSSSSESDTDTGDLNSGPRGRTGSTWETLVLFAVNFTRLNVHMNMGNVMGNVTWQSKDFRSEGRLGIGSTGRKNLYIGIGLGGSALDAKGGIVGGTFELADIETYVRVREEPGERPEPDHTVGARLHALELRLDYMGTSVLMCRVSALDVTLRDEWRLQTLPISRLDATRRPATVFVHGVLGWRQLQCLISKSSTADLIKMYHKLDEFFSQQFNSSKRAFSRFGGGGNTNEQTGGVVTRQQSLHETEETNTGGTEKKAGVGTAGGFGPTIRHHRHWQRALAHSAGLKLRHWALPDAGTVLGGTMELHGQNVSLACFHGINFKSKSWALFSLREPSVSFNTEAQEIAAGEPTNGPHDVHVVQTLTCSLGLSTYKTHHSMATVCKVSRSVMFPPQFKSLHEWFHYAFASSQIDEVDRFPSLERERQAGGSGKLIDPNHTREVIFALPSLQLHLKTEHLQTAETPNGEDAETPRPTVDCSFITEFEDHIFVTVDAEAFFFLHDLISSYLKEKERVTGGVTRRTTFSRPNRQGVGLNSEDTNSFRENSSMSRDSDDGREDPGGSGDWRLYRCKTWHLEPTVRLLSWAGKSIEPYGIDYILQKLGFSHARTTIPKWMQRGFMDPLDKVLAVLALRMVTAVRHDPPPQPALPPPPPL